MEQWYKDARDQLNKYQFYYRIVNSATFPKRGNERARRMQYWCEAVATAVNRLPDRQAALLRYEFLELNGGRLVAQRQLQVANSQYCSIRKQAIANWWELVNRGR
ncbi:hypothetical protein ACFP1L_05030 [Lactiplantibacillus nangangensis]|uniref:Uncharacterized protein n=1 Tax=Lactiplantibacillus nangangensis TaxID=2559917 RepID=A0ABW1SJ58_9LACO|nr:hypothetical protein [Lactiplantibacillus nangangensis]